MRLLLSTLLLFFLLNTTYADDRTPVKIGLITPLTSSQANNGETIKNTAELVLELIMNKSKNYKYSLQIEDGRCGDGNAAVSAAHKLVNVENIRFLITSCSGTTIKTAPIADKRKTLVIAVLSSHKDVKHLGDYIFRTYIDVEKATKKISHLIKSDGKTRLAILTEDNPFTAGISEVVESESKDIIVFSDFFPYDSTDFRTLLMKTKAADADALYLSMASPTSAVNIMKQMGQLDIDTQAYMFHMPDLGEFTELVGNTADGLKYIGTPKLGTGTPEYQMILKEYHERFKKPPFLELVVRTTFDALMAFNNGIEKNGPDATKVKDFLYTYKAEGALGDIEFDKNGDIKNVDYALKQIEGTEKVFLE